VTLQARLADGGIVVGQSRIARTSGIAEVWLSPAGIRASDDAVRAIADAEAIVLGPGSLFTSLLPALLVPGIRDAVATSPALKVFVCNVATQAGETSGFDLADHLEALERHTHPGLVDVVMANNDLGAHPPSESGAEAVRLRWPPAGDRPPRLVLDDVVDHANAHHHDAARLAADLVRLIERETGARGRARPARSA
jgi:uncharacterized cofD-like protein